MALTTMHLTIAAADDAEAATIKARLDAMIGAHTAPAAVATVTRNGLTITADSDTFDWMPA